MDLPPSSVFVGSSLPPNLDASELGLQIGLFYPKKMQTTVGMFMCLWTGCETLMRVHLYKAVDKKGKLGGQEGAFNWRGLTIRLNVCPCAPPGQHPGPRPLFLIKFLRIFSRRCHLRPPQRGGGCVSWSHLFPWAVLIAPCLGGV